jgi:hypothetical protein
MRGLLILVFLFISLTGKSQYSSTYLRNNAHDHYGSKLLSKDSHHSTQSHSAKKATIYSAVLPGLGQIYNKNYLKAVIFDAGFITAGALMIHNRKFLRKHREDLNARTDNDTNSIPIHNPDWSENRLIGERDFRLQNRNYAIIAMAAIYGLNILDANVSGHLFEFNINQKLSGSLAPRYQFNGFKGFSFKLRF